MIAFLVRVALLAWSAWLEYPAASLVDVVRVAWHAAGAESDGVPAELLISIAEHESDLQPCAVSFVDARGARRDIRDGCAHDIPPAVVCGYLSAMGNRETCALQMRRDGAMAYGARELAQWARETCGADVRCVMRGHAGGTACARDARACTSDQRAFVDGFMFHAGRMARRINSGKDM